MNVSIANNFAQLPDGQTVNLSLIQAACSQYPAAAAAFALLTGSPPPHQLPVSLPGAGRVLVIVDGGVADFVADVGVDVRIFDRDNAREGALDPMPASWADLAGPSNIPFLPDSATPVEVHASFSKPRLGKR